MGDEEILLVGNEEELDLTNSHLPSLNDIPLKPSLKVSFRRRFAV